MTWIVGAAALLGYSIGISDIRVTFADGTARDCLQKIYPISRFIVAGFAGSVKIGFTMIDGLSYCTRHLPEGHAWIPQLVADRFSEVAERIFRSSSPDEQALHSHLMLLGAHPMDNMGIPGYARCSVHVMRSPDFRPHLAPIGEVVSIGSGNSVKAYQAVLASFSSDPLSLLQMETAGPGMGSLPLIIAIQKTVETNPAEGISTHSHVAIVRQGSISISANDHEQFPPGGEKIEFRMPPVATSWPEFIQMVSAASKSSEGAIC